MWTLILHVKVCKGLDLPKTELLSEIDPYVKVLTPSDLEDEELVAAGVPIQEQGASLQTRQIDNDANPTWNEDFFVPVDVSEEGHLLGNIRFELWAKGMFGDQFCGFCYINLFCCPFSNNREEMTLEISYADDKKGKFSKQKRHSRLKVQVLGSILSSVELCDHLGPTSFHSADFSDVYIALDRERGLYCGVHYDTRSVSYSMHVCKSNNQHVDIAYYGDDLEEPFVVSRRVYQNGKKMFPGITCYEEVWIMGLPLYIDLDNLLLSVEERKAKEYIQTDELLRRVEWPGPSVDFNRASQEVSHSDQVFVDEHALYVRCGKAESSSRSGSSSKAQKQKMYAAVKLDYESGGPGMSAGQVVQWMMNAGGGLKGLYLCVLRTRQGTTWEWMNPDCEVLETLSMSNQSPEPILGGKASVLRKIKLSPVGVSEPKEALQLQLDSFVVRYSVKNYMDWSVYEILDPRGEYEEEAVEEEVDPVPELYLGIAQAPKLLEGAASLSGDVFRGIGAGAKQVGKVTMGAGKLAAGGAGVLSGALSSGVKQLTTGVMTMGVSLTRFSAHDEDEDETQASSSGRKTKTRDSKGVERSRPSTNRPLSKSRWERQQLGIEEEEEEEDGFVSDHVKSTHRVAHEARDKLVQRGERLEGLSEKASNLEADAKEFASLAKAKRDKASNSFF